MVLLLLLAAIEPLPAEQASAVSAVASDPLPRATWALSYVRSNEWRHDLVFSQIRDLGGAYVGVGSDQNYRMAAVAKSELIWLVDADIRVTALHRLYGALLRDADSPKTFLAAFEDPASLQRIKPLLAGDEADHTAVVLFQQAAFRQSQGEYLRNEAALGSKRPHSWWLSNNEMFNSMREMFLAGRVRAITGDFTKAGCVGAVAKATQTAGLKVRVVYLSNAEEYFKVYDTPAQANFSGLPHDDKSVLVRTLRQPGWPYATPGDRWHYVVQSYEDFVDKIARPEYHALLQMVGDVKRDRAAWLRAQAGYSRIDASGPPRTSRGGQH